MTRYIVRRLLFLPIILFGVTILQWFPPGRLSDAIQHVILVVDLTYGFLDPACASVNAYVIKLLNR
ncbi:MAG TPA: hypothetical protein VFD70_02100 [Anaerolineae bacterium]|nr:hypothetical protein [Anaerolineae bacterium]